MITPRIGVNERACHVSALEEWSETVKLIISNRINSLQHRSFLPCHRILEDPHIKAYLTELQSKYVLVPADKADNNIIFVCKYYYIHTLIEELGINSGMNLNSTYVTQDSTNNTDSCHNTGGCT